MAHCAGEYEEFDRLVDEKFKEAVALVNGDQDLIDRGWLAPIGKMAYQHDVFVRSCEKLIVAVKAGKPFEDIDHIADEIEKQSGELMKHIDGFLEVNTDEVMEDSMEAKLHSTSAVIKIAVVGICAIIAGIVLAFFLTRSITGPVTVAIKFAEKISNGDFTERIELARKDEIGVLVAALNKMHLFGALCQKTLLFQT